MKTTQNLTVVRSVAIIGVAIALVVVLAGAHGPLPVASGQGRPSDPATPAASIDKIVINEKNEIEAFDNVIVIRANGEKVQGVTTGLLLYRGDTIETAKNTKVTILFLDSPAPEKHNQIIIDGDAKLGISSGDSWWGRAWTKVSGFFTSKTTYVKVGATGTEYELNVSKDGRQTTVVMLEGEFLDITRGTFVLAGQRASIGPVQRDVRTTTPQFITTSFGRENSAQEQVGRALDVRAGELTPFDLTYNITNGCGQRHRFEFRTSDNTPWLQLEVQRTWVIAPKQSRAIPAKLNIDARQMAAGAYRGHVYLVCLDCNQEALCPGSRLDWPYYVTVSGPGPIVTPSPTPPATATPTPFRITELQEVLIPNSPEPASPQRTSDDRVRAVLEWTNGVILKTQPTYSAEGLFPHFAAVEQRSQNFRTAREQAILRHSPGSNKVLGDVYSDWGQAGQAAKAYEIERKNSGGPQNSVDSAEAQRLIGKPDQARDMIQASADSRSAAGQNLLGNVYTDYARISLDKKDWAQARAHLDQAETFYRSASTSLARQRGAAADSAVQANLAKTQIFQGDVLLAATPGSQVGAAQQARTRYASALQLLSSTQPAETNYPFGVQTVGRAHQGLGDAAMLAGEPAAAADAYANAKAHYNRVISAHPDCAEAYFRLGDLYDDLGDKENAKLNYRRAIQTRPEQPASYYPLALLLQTENPELARALATTYLKLEPEVFKQGEKARNAERITRGEPVPLPVRIGTVATVPGVVNKPLAQATRELETAAYRIVKIDRRVDASPADTVIAQSPAAGTPAPRELAINLIVSSGPINPVVPGVVNKPLAQATRELETAAYRIVKIDRRVDASPADTVIAQSPAAGTPAPGELAISLIVSSGPGSIEPVVPNVRDLTLAEARSSIEKANLRVGRVAEKPDNDKPAGVVLKQRPEAGKKVLPNSLVDLEVATSKPVEVPDIVDDRDATARKKILDKRLAVGNVSQRASCESVGKVIEQTPIKKTKVEPGRAVDFVIGSLGDNPMSVPRFIGRSRNDVDMAVREQRFILSKVRTQETDDARPGTVMEQSPSEGTQFAQGCPVKIEITVAEPLTSVGNYVGLSESGARRQLAAIRLSADVRYEESRDEPGMVLSQSPPPDSRVRRGSPVSLIVSVRPVKVPNVIGKSLQEAQQILANAGLAVGSVRRVEDRGSDFPAGSVISQDPNPEQIVAARTRVNLVVRAASRPPQDFPGTRQPQIVIVPRTYDMLEKDARTAIERAGLRVGTSLRCIQVGQMRGLVDGKAAGTDPPEGTSLAAQTPVTLIIARVRCGPD